MVEITLDGIDVVVKVGFLIQNELIKENNIKDIIKQVNFIL